MYTNLFGIFSDTYLPTPDNGFAVSGVDHRVYNAEAQFYQTGINTSLWGQADQATRYISGDFYWNSVKNGQYLHGGNDTLDVSGYVVTGDTYYGDSGTRTVGGDDAISLRKNLHDNSYTVNGDMQTTRGSVWGGDDVIIGYLGETISGSFHGDAKTVLGSGGGFGGDDIITGTNTNDTIYGDFYDVSNAYHVTSGDDTLEGLGGDDLIVGDVGKKMLNSSYSMTYGSDTISGGAGNDTIFGDAKETNSAGEADTISGGAGNDTVNAGGGNDIIAGGSGVDLLFGESGNDTIDGDAGNDFIEGGNGADVIKGGDDNDLLYGSTQRTVYQTNTGADVIYGGAGNDGIAGDNGADQLHGGDDNDGIWGSGGDDMMYGDAGNDRLFGGNGNDVLSGGQGDDILDGQTGDDTMTGGEGADTFVFKAASEDVVTDFDLADDVIDLRGTRIGSFDELQYMKIGSLIDGVSYTWISIDGANDQTNDLQINGIDQAELTEVHFLFG